MSTKIYHGFRFRARALHTINQAISDFRKELEPLVHQKTAEVLADHVARLIDDAAVAGKLAENVLADAFIALCKRQDDIKRTQRRDPEVDFEFQVAVIPYDGGVLGITFTEQEEWRERWMKKWIVEEYGYWNNSDRPDNINARGWRRRAKAWDKAVGHEPINMRGLLADCTHEYQGFPKVELVVQKVPTLEERLRRQVMDALASPWMKQAAEQAGETLTERNFIHYFREFGRWFKTPAAKAEIEKKQEELKKLLPAKITKEMLIGKSTSGEPPKPTRPSAEPS